MCCGNAADVWNSDEGYSHCCNDRITSDPMEHPLMEDVEDPRTVKIEYVEVRP